MNNAAEVINPAPVKVPTKNSDIGLDIVHLLGKRKSREAPGPGRAAAGSPHTVSRG
jgi:hypothetical protein